MDKKLSDKKVATPKKKKIRFHFFSFFITLLFVLGIAFFAPFFSGGNFLSQQKILTHIFQFEGISKLFGTSVQIDDLDSNLDGLTQERLKIKAFAEAAILDAQAKGRLTLSEFERAINPKTIHNKEQDTQAQQNLSNDKTEQDTSESDSTDKSLDILNLSEEKLKQELIEKQRRDVFKASLPPYTVGHLGVNLENLIQHFEAKYHFSLNAKRAFGREDKTLESIKIPEALQKLLFKALKKRSKGDVPPDGRTDLSQPYEKSGVILVNPEHWVDSSYAPGPSQQALSAYLKMRQDAAEDGVGLMILSQYRSYNSQERVLANWYKVLSKEEVENTSAFPGQSEHQTGLALDLNSLETSFGQTKAGRWLAQNCYKYGFIIRYPEGKEYITGYTYEPWHIRYVGVDIASDFGPDSDLTLEEYLGDFTLEKALDLLEKTPLED